MMIFLLADYVRDAGLRKRFEADPNAVLDDYGISQRARNAFRNVAEDRGPALAHLRSEIESQLDAILDEVRVRTPWPGHQPECATLAPTVAQVGTAVVFTVTGQNFEDGATLTFARPGVEIKTTGTVSNAGTILTAGATFDQTGAYDVTLQNPNGGTCSFPQGLTVTT